MEGPFSLKYFFKGKGKTDWYDAWGIGWRLIATLVIILLLTIGIRSLLPKPKQQQINIGNVEQGGSVTIKQGDERKWWIPYIFAEPFYEVNSYADKPIFGARFGLRWEK